MAFVIDVFARRVVGWPASRSPSAGHPVPFRGRGPLSGFAQAASLADVHFPKADKIVLVQDNLGTHTPASLYAAFPPAEARRLVERFEWHFTPKHGSWLNMAEGELAVLARQCLDRRIEDKATLVAEAAV